MAAILFFVFVGKDNETSVQTNVAQNPVTAKADSIQPAKTEETAEKVDSTNVEKTDNTLNEEPTKATAEMPSSESNSKQSSKPDVVKEEKKNQTSAIPVMVASNRKLLLLYVVLTVMDWRENKSSVTNTLLSKTRLTKCIVMA